MIPAAFKTYKRTPRPFKSANWLLFYDQNQIVMLKCGHFEKRRHFGFWDGFKLQEIIPVMKEKWLAFSGTLQYSHRLVSDKWFTKRSHFKLLRLLRIRACKEESKRYPCKKWISQSFNLHIDQSFELIRIQNKVLIVSDWLIRNVIAWSYRHQVRHGTYSPVTFHITDYSSSIIAV